MDLYNLIISAKLTKGGGGGGDIDVESLSVTENGTYTAPSGKAYSPVTVSVPASGITPTGTKAINANGMYDVTDFASASVNVPVGVFPSGTKSIAENGIYDITNFSSVDVNVSGGGGGDHEDEDAIIARTIAEYANDTATRVGPYAFDCCKSLSNVRLTKATYIGSYAFWSCKALTTLELLTPSVAELENRNAWGNTPMENSSFTGSFGSIYVPASLVDSYKSAPGWKYFSSIITAYEGE